MTRQKRKLRQPIRTVLRFITILVAAYALLTIMAIYLGAAHEQTLNKYNQLEIHQEELINENNR